MDVLARVLSRYALVAMACPLLSCAGGQMVETEKWSPPSVASDGARMPLTGLPYYLPRGVIPVSIGGGTGASGDASSGDKPKKSASAGGGSAEAAVKHKPCAALPAPVPAPAPPTHPAPAEPHADTADPKPDPYMFTATLGAPVFLPDATHKYFLHMTSDLSADDTLSLKVDQNGLLTSSKGESVDQTAATGAALVQLAAIAAGNPPGAVGLRVETRTATKTNPCQLPNISESFQFDPDKGVAPKRYSSADTKQWVQVNVTVPKDANADTDDSKGELALPAQGVLFRDWVVWTITLHVEASDEAEKACHIGHIDRTVSVLLPNGGKFFAEDMSRAPLVDKKMALAVKNGMLVGVDRTKPSFWLALVSFPIKLIQPLLAAPLSGLSPAANATPAPSGTTSPPAASAPQGSSE